MMHSEAHKIVSLDIDLVLCTVWWYSRCRRSVRSRRVARHWDLDGNGMCKAHRRGRSNRHWACRWCRRYQCWVSKPQVQERWGNIGNVGWRRSGWHYTRTRRGKDNHDVLDKPVWADATEDAISGSSSPLSDAVKSRPWSHFDVSTCPWRVPWPI